MGFPNILMNRDLCGDFGPEAGIAKKDYKILGGAGNRGVGDEEAGRNS